MGLTQNIIRSNVCGWSHLSTTTIPPTSFSSEYITVRYIKNTITSVYLPPILQVHFPATYPKPVFRLHPFPSQYWHKELQVKLMPPHWPFWHLSDLVHFWPSSQDIPFLFVQAEVVELGLHHCKNISNTLTTVSHKILHRRNNSYNCMKMLKGEQYCFFKRKSAKSDFYWIA